jgi:hypothetical protein
MAQVSSFDRRRRAQLMGYLSAGEDTGEMAGPILAGLLWSAFGAPVLLVARMGLALGAEVFTSRMTRDLEYEPAAHRTAQPRRTAAPRGRQSPSPGAVASPPAS